MAAQHSHNVELITLANAMEMAPTAANAWLDAVRISNERGQPQYVALSGGRIAKDFFEAIVAGAKARAVSLANIHFFWADERCVPPNDPESNFALADKFLFRPLSIAADHVHRIHGEENPDKAARDATNEIRRYVPTDEPGIPVLDIIFLGMGEDGHVASLFPETQVPESTVEVFCPVVAPKPPPNRVTLTYSGIRKAQDVWVLVSGMGKRDALKTSLNPAGRTPLARVIKSRQRTRILTDILHKELPTADGRKEEGKLPKNS